MNKMNWTAMVVFGGVALVVVLIGCGLLWMMLGGFGGMMGPGGMMGGWRPWGGGTGVLGGGNLALLLVLFLIGLAVLFSLGLLAVGVVWLVRRTRKDDNSIGSS